MKKEQRIDELLKACSINSDSKIIFCCVGEVNFKTMAKSFTTKSHSAEVRFFILNIGEALQILNHKATIVMLNSLKEL